MEWEKPQLVDLNMVKYEMSCGDGASVKDTKLCAPVGSGANGCEQGSGIV